MAAAATGSSGVRGTAHSARPPTCSQTLSTAMRIESATSTWLSSAASATPLANQKPVASTATSPVEGL
jgi:hypothetical protein